MFRDNSEIAVAISVASPGEKPTRDASARPCWRAATMSLSTLIGTTVSSAKVRIRSPIAASGSPPSHVLSGLPVQVRQPLFQVERGGDPLEREPQLDHRKGDLWLNPNNHGLGPTQAGHVSEVAQRAGRERVHHVQGRNIDDDAARTKLADLRHQRLAESLQVLVVERGLDRRDQIVTLLENRNWHGRPRSSSRCWTALEWEGPCSPGAVQPPRCHPA